ncbi:hypothetical protein [Bartonella sp. A05]|uniref:hypothetical protein n=1 Tax=Bartonella sp. A05 TaxID=2967261 RepID=UPI0022A9B8EF|nr:hypothetical protein [Bartonella sp. A05]MCZ2203638.1 hypothetical protein [Bartonella sp. A05]
MDSEIIQQDDILIEKHGNGRFEGFRFYTNKNITGQETDTQSLTDNDNLVSAFAKRAARFCAAANGDFTLSSDGLVRWIGQPVGQLVPTEDILKPKPILFADAQLTGEARDKVMARLERFVIFHFETALKPLFDLCNADTLTDTTRSLALQLVNSLGVLPRRKVAETVKNLDQESRAVLRRLGVRFGAFHIYVIAMLKPIPAQAITLLWRLQNENSNQSGLNEILAALVAGRTSLVVDPTYNQKFYQLAGYQVLGRRAVRIDILERLANLIRPALNWKPEMQPKPDGAYDGKSFFVTPTMMSILGANGTDMEEILKGLGYQSQPISSAGLENARLEQTLTQEKSSNSENMTEQNYPEAECIGDQWQAMQGSEVVQKKHMVSTASFEENSCAENCLPAAEPVGDFSVQKPIATTKEKIVLLWRYNHQHHHSSHRARGESRQMSQNKHRKTFKKEFNTRDEAAFKEPSHVKRSHKGNKTYINRPNTLSSQTRKRLDPDSPFAKLAALRDQLKNG